VVPAPPPPHTLTHTHTHTHPAGLEEGTIGRHHSWSSILLTGGKGPDSSPNHSIIQQLQAAWHCSKTSDTRDQVNCIAFDPHFTMSREEWGSRKMGQVRVQGHRASTCKPYSTTHQPGSYSFSLCLSRHLHKMGHKTTTEAQIQLASY
jgi:hypothetical protein